jgi:deoxycytidylate deaminase
MSRHTLTAYAYDKRGRLLASANNNYVKSHPLQAHFAELVGQPERKYLHAEIAVLLKCKTTKVHRVHVERFYKDGNPAPAMPCEVCKAAIKAFGVQLVTST